MYSGVSILYLDVRDVCVQKRRDFKNGRKFLLRFFDDEGDGNFFLFLTVFRPESDHSYNFSRKKWRRNREVISPLCQYVVCIQHTAAKINLCSKKKKWFGFFGAKIQRLGQNLDIFPQCVSKRSGQYIWIQQHISFVQKSH